MNESRCPVAGFDPFAPETLDDPYQKLESIREAGGVAYLSDLDHYLVLRFDDVMSILFDRETWSAANASSPLNPVCPRAQAVLDEGYHRVPTLNNADAPRHAPMRRAVFRNMTPMRLNGLESSLRDYARALVEPLVERPTFDVVDALSFPFPGYATFSLLGFPESDTDQLKAWSATRVLLTYGRLSEDGQVTVAGDIVAFWQYVERFVAERMKDPVDDVTSDLARYSFENPDEVTEFDIVNMVYSMALAGHETTTNAITNGVLALMRHRDQWQLLIDQPELIPNAVEEILRYDGPVFLHRRIARADAEFDGRVVPAGGRVMMGFGPAGRDPEHFDHADAFDVTRTNASEHLAFGKGAHLCLGAPLARLEIRIVLELLTELMPGAELVPDQELEYIPNALFRGLKRLLIAPRGSAAAGA